MRIVAVYAPSKSVRCILKKQIMSETLLKRISLE